MTWLYRLIERLDGEKGWRIMPYKTAQRIKMILLSFMVSLIICMGLCPIYADTWKITAYCSCYKCCGKSDGITASGLPARVSYIACNWLPFGTKVSLEGLGTFRVMDRGARSLFGSKDNHIKHIDIWLPTHKEARTFGVQYKEVRIL